MLVYEHARTERVVNKLISAERTIRTLTVVVSVLIFGVSFASVCSLGASDSGRGVAVVVGLVLGGSIGIVVARLLLIVFSAVMEWMCQVLIALGAGVATSRPASKH